MGIVRHGQEHARMGVDTPTTKRGGFYKVGAIGDSLTAICSPSTTTPTSITSAAGVMTLTGGAAWHGGTSGMPFSLVDLDQDEYEGIWQMGAGTTSTVINNVVFPGSATAEATGVSGCTCQKLFQSSDRDWLGMACALSGGALTRGLPIGFGGKTAEVVASRLHWLESDNDAVVVLCGANNVRAITTGGDWVTAGDSLFATLRGMWLALLAQGKTPIVCTLTPQSNTVSAWVSEHGQMILYVNKLIRQWCKANPKALFCDFYRVCVDPLSTTGNWKAGLSDDGLHQAAGCYEMGVELNSVLAAAGVQRFSPLPQSVLDSFGTNALNMQYIDNPLGSASGGTIGAGVDAGSAVWSGWTLSATGSATVVGSCPARADGFGYDQVITVTNTVNNDAVTFTKTSAISSRLKVGDQVRMVAEVSLSGATALKRSEMQMAVTIGGVTAGVAFSRQSSSSISQADRTMTYATPEVTVTEAGNITPVFYLGFSGVGAAVVKIGRIAVYKVE